MRKVKFGLWVMLIHLTAVLPLWAQKNLADWSITDDCTMQAAGFDADLTPLFDKDDLTAIQLPQLKGNEEIVMRAGRKYVLRGLSVVSADDEQQDLKQLAVYVSNDGQQWKLVRSLQLGFDRRFGVQQVNTPYSGAYEWFKLALKKSSGSSGLRVAEIQLFGYPESHDGDMPDVVSGTLKGPAKARLTENLNDNDPTTMAVIADADRQQIDNFNGERRYNGLINTWFEYELKEPAVVSAYSLGMTGNAERNSRPCCWELMASNDRSQWVTLDLQHYAASMAIDHYEQLYVLGAAGAHIDYGEVAERMMRFCEEQLERRQGSTGIYWIADWAIDAARRNEDWGGYWWAAHGVDNYIDSYLRTQRPERLAKMAAMVEGARMRNGNTLINHFYDDMEWMALALLRACDISSDIRRKYWNEVVTLFNDITGAWSDTYGGGLHWNKDKTGDGKYKNSCANAPAMILAARLYQQTGEQRYLDWALRIYDFMSANCRFPDGVVKDYATNNDHEVTFSYNQGTWVGGLLELYRITGEEHYRTIATQLLDLLLFGKWYSPMGIMNERQNFNQDDGGLFKGIFVRYLAQWIVSGCLDDERQYRYGKWLVEQARAAVLSAVDKTWFVVNPYWTRQYHLEQGDVHDTSRQQSGMMLMEAVDLMRRCGQLNPDYSVPNANAGRAFRYYRLVITETQGDGTVRLGSWKLLGGKPTSDGVTTAPATGRLLRDGRRLDLRGMPTRRNRPGIYIMNGSKYLVSHPLASQLFLGQDGDAALIEL